MALALTEMTPVAPGKYELINLIFNCTPVGAPTNPDEVRLTVQFTAPSGAVHTRNGFYYQAFTYASWYTPPKYAKYERGAPYYVAGDTDWRCRILPDEVGTWTWRAYLLDGGKFDTTTGSFVVTASSLPGPLQMGDTPFHPLKLEGSSTAFFPAGVTCGSYTQKTVESDLSRLEGGPNFLRFNTGYMGYRPDGNLSDSGINSACLDAGLGDYTGVGQLEMWRLEQVLGLCQEYGVWLFPALFSDLTPYNNLNSKYRAAQGGPVVRRVDFWGYMCDANISATDYAATNYEVWFDESLIPVNEAGEDISDSVAPTAKLTSGGVFSGPWIVHIEPTEDCVFTWRIGSHDAGCYFVVELDGETVYSVLDGPPAVDLTLDIPAGSHVLRYGFGGTNADLDNPTYKTFGSNIFTVEKHRFVGYRSKPEGYLDAFDYQKRAWAYMMDRVGDHPAIGAWQVINEGYNALVQAYEEPYEKDVYYPSWYEQVSEWLQENDPHERPVINGGDMGDIPRSWQWDSSYTDIGDNHVYYIWHGTVVRTAFNRALWDLFYHGIPAMYAECGNAPAFSPTLGAWLGPPKLRTMVSIALAMVGQGQIDYVRSDLDNMPGFTDAYAAVGRDLSGIPSDCVIDTSLSVLEGVSKLLDTPRDLWLCCGDFWTEAPSNEQSEITVDAAGRYEAFGSKPLNRYIQGSKWDATPQQNSINFLWQTAGKCRIFVADVDNATYGTLKVLADGVEVGSWALTSAANNTWIECDVPEGTEKVEVTGGGNLTTHIEIHWIVFTGQQTEEALLALNRYSDEYVAAFVMNPECDTHTYMGEPGHTTPETYPNQGIPETLQSPSVQLKLPSTGHWTISVTDDAGEVVETEEVVGLKGELFVLDLPAFSTYLMLRATKLQEQSAVQLSSTSQGAVALNSASQGKVIIGG